MYNGIGLQTARGSGTNGYVQRNWAAIRVSKDKVTVCTEADAQAFEAASSRQPNVEILEHERKRKLEIKCAELEDALEEQGFSASEIEVKVAALRKLLTETGAARDVKRDQWGREAPTETHETADAQQRKNQRLKEAFGISDDHVPMHSAPAPSEQEKAAKAALAIKEAPKVESPPRNRRYGLVRTPSPEPVDAKKKKKKRSRSRSRDKERSSRKREKKHRRHRSRSR
ncbi:serine/arginine repetitive matrix protein 2-like [Cloeon dipterum]|uniref:serine/arginine repetitive matrix protein 2-like n=1 Tax=Cloeon dipterum TaxID=197152 RepID=UPI0032206D09